MDNEIDKFSWFLDNFFGLRIKPGEILRFLNNQKDQEIFVNVASRLWFTDQLRYKTIISPGIVVPSDMPNFLLNEVLALQQHLLFTCIDALAEKNFITFPDWLNVSKKKKKAEYVIMDEDISRTISSANLSDPDVFRRTAFHVYQSCYQPIHGIKISINNFLLKLPVPLKQILADLYVIVRTSRDVEFLILDQNGYPLDLVDNWVFEINKWNSLELDKKIYAIANYYYSILRNPYTHIARTAPQKPLNHHNKSKQEDSYMIYDYYREQKLLVLYKQKNIEDENLILRLVIIIGWLAKVGFPVDEDFITRFREYQIRREYMFLSLQEIASIKQLNYLYTKRTYNELSNMSARWALAKFPIHYLMEFFLKLRTTADFEKEISTNIGSFVARLAILNKIIEEQNENYIPKSSIIPTEKERLVLERVMPKAFDAVKDKISHEDFEQKCTELTEYLEYLTGWMVEY